MGGIAAVALGLIVALVVIVYVAAAVKIVRPYEKGIVERLGKYQRTYDSGLHLIMPFVDRLTKVDMRENVVDVPPQEAITKANVGSHAPAMSRKPSTRAGFTISETIRPMPNRLPEARAMRARISGTSDQMAHGKDHHRRRCHERAGGYQRTR